VTSKTSKAKPLRSKAKKSPAKPAKKKTAKKKATAKTASKAPAKARKKKTAKAPAAKQAKSAKPAATAGKTRPGKIKSPLTAAQLRKFRQMLLTKRRDILGDMHGIEAEAFRGSNGNAGDLSSMPTHPADVGTDNYEQEFSLGLLESERALLDEINAALARIQDRTYGICLGTGEPIGVPRLTARPWAQYGIEYARMVEQGLVRPGEAVDE